MSFTDSIIPFMFESLPVRGALVQLQVSWQRMRVDHQYAESVEAVLGEAAAATVLIAQSLKFDGSVTLQISGPGPLSMLVMQSTDDLDLRGMAIATSEAEGLSFEKLVADANCAVTVDAGAMERPYQGIVEISPVSIGASLENYFARSVQVQSHLVLLSSATHCGGILLQQMPGEAAIGEDDWRRLGMMMATLNVAELSDGATPRLLQKLFSEDDVRVFQARSLRFKCRCSQSRVEEVLRFLGERETRAALAEKGSVAVTCEYCGRVRTLDAVDVSRVFAGILPSGSSALH